MSDLLGRSRDGVGPAGATPCGQFHALVELLELFLDNPQRQVVVTLHGQDVSQPRDVVVTEAAISGRRALRLDQTLGFQETNLGDRDAGKVRTQLLQNLPDVEDLSRRQRRTHLGPPPNPCWPE